MGQGLGVSTSPPHTLPPPDPLHPLTTLPTPWGQSFKIDKLIQNVKEQLFLEGKRKRKKQKENLFIDLASATHL